VAHAQVTYALHVIGQNIGVIPLELDNEMGARIVIGQRRVQEALRQPDGFSVHELD